MCWLLVPGDEFHQMNEFDGHQLGENSRSRSKRVKFIPGKLSV